MIFCGDIAQPYANASTLQFPKEFGSKVWVGNLEGSLIKYGKKNLSYQGVFNDFDAIKKLCHQIPFKAFSLANNHLLDFADVKRTLDNIKELGVVSVGAGCNLEEAQQSLIIEDADGMPYRILSFGWENIQCPIASRKRQGVNPYTKKNVMECVEKALRQNEPVICFMHWDYELELYPQPYDRHLAHELIDKGVCAVIGCHAHRVQQIEFYKGHPIVYGLGNFLFMQGAYSKGKSRFPAYCENEYALEISNRGNQYCLHCFKYNLQTNTLSYKNTINIDSNADFEGKAIYNGFTNKEYEIYFKNKRVQRKMLPIFKTSESSHSYALKSSWIKMRGALIDILVQLNLKNKDRSQRK